MKPFLSLVILGFRNFDLTTRKCLESLLACQEDPEVEVLLVDNGSPDNSAELTRQWCAQHPKVMAIVSEKNLGFSGGMNLGSSHASGDWLVLVNNDTIFPSSAIPALKRVLRAAPNNVAMVGPVSNAAGNSQRLWLPDADETECLTIGERLHQNPSHRLIPIYRSDFFCVAIRKQIWAQLGGLDESFGLGYYEDFDFSLRVTAAGLEQVMTEDVFVYHAGSATFKTTGAAKALLRSNKERLRSKHPDARFQHVRQGNLEVMQHYQELKNLGLWTPALQMRWDLRVGALNGDVPRNALKKWWWQRKTGPLLRATP